MHLANVWKQASNSFHIQLQLTAFVFDSVFLGCPPNCMHIPIIKA